jgi:hypothetical protein
MVSSQFLFLLSYHIIIILYFIITMSEPSLKKVKFTTEIQFITIGELFITFNCNKFLKLTIAKICKSINNTILQRL